MNRKLFFAIGLSIWLLATIIFRLAGHLFFLDDDPAILTILWLVTVIALFLIAIALFHRHRLTRQERFEAAVLLVISGMTLDAFISERFVDIFPNMPESSAGSFGAWLLIAYASVLLAAFAPARDHRSTT